MSCFASYYLQTSVLNSMREDNKTFSFYLSNVTTNVPCIVCNVFVNRVCLHALFLYIICAMSVLKAPQSSWFIFLMYRH